MKEKGIKAFFKWLFSSNTKNEAQSDNTVKKESRKVIKRTVQEVLDFEGITVDGIIYGNGYFSKLYKMVDANFDTEPEDKQFDMLMDYSRLINKFPEKVQVSVVIVNQRITNRELSDAYHLSLKNDEYDVFRNDYNNIIDKKIDEGDNDISKDKYILLTVRDPNLKAARQTFNTCDMSLQEAVKSLNGVGVVQTDGIERLEIMANILKDSNGIPFRSEYSQYISSVTDSEGEVREELALSKLKRRGMSVKDTIAPQVIQLDKQCLYLGEDRYCKSFSFANLPSSLDTSFLTKITNLPYEMVTVVQFRTVPRKKAVNYVKMQNVSVKADVIKASQQAARGGYSADLINEDLQLAQEQSRKIRNDVVQEGRKLFFTTMVSTVFAKDIEELDMVTGLYKSVCADYTVTPSYLYGQQKAGLNTACLCGNSKVIIDRMLTSDDACALFPFSNQELRDNRGLFYGINALSRNMIMYDRKHSDLPNGLVFGQSGSGKSFITKGEIIPHFLDSEDKVIILDPENEYGVIARKLGGTVIDFELSSDYHINPCDLAMEWDDPKASPYVAKCDYMVGLVESILGRGRECNAYEVNVIHRACNVMYEDYIAEMTRRHKECEPNADLDTTICPTLKDFYNALVEDGTPEGNKIAMAIEPYCIGNYNLFAHHTNVDTDSRMIVYNLLDLPFKMREMAMKVCLSNIWTTVTKNSAMMKKYGKDRAVWVYLDEFHLFFQTESSATTILTFFKRVRKYGGIMTGITQDVADLLNTTQGTGMFNNSGFFIFLKQSPVGRKHLKTLYQISDSLIEYLKKDRGIGLIYNNSILIPFNYALPNDSPLYVLMSTKPSDAEKQLEQNKNNN